MYTLTWLGFEEIAYAYKVLCKWLPIFLLISYELLSLLYFLQAYSQNNLNHSSHPSENIWREKGILRKSQNELSFCSCICLFVCFCKLVVLYSLFIYKSHFTQSSLHLLWLPWLVCFCMYLRSPKVVHNSSQSRVLQTVSIITHNTDL